MRYVTRYLAISAACCCLTFSVRADGPRAQTPNDAFQSAYRLPDAYPTRAAAGDVSPRLNTWLVSDPGRDLLEISGGDKYDDWSPASGRWWVQADVLFLDRIGNGCDQVLAFDTHSPESAVMSTKDLDFSMDPGWRVLLGFRPDPSGSLGCCSALEFSYFGVYGWKDSVTAVGDQNLRIPGDLGLAANNFLFADEIRAVYRSRLNNVEANCVKSCFTDCYTQIDFLLGFRFLALNEEFSLIGTDLAEGTSSYDISTSNYLYGLQMGGRMTRQMQRWALQFTGKAGVFLNDARQSQVVTDFPDFPDPFVHRLVPGVSRTSAAMLGEVDLTLVRQITDVWSARLGYSVLGVGGLALAPDQLDFTLTPVSGTGVSTDGFVLFHGVHAGLEAAW